MRYIDAADVPTAKPAEVSDANAVRDGTGAGILIDDVSDGRGANKKTVVVIVNRGVIFIPRADEFRGVTSKKEILQVDVAEDDLLVAPIKSVETAVRVLLEEVEIGQVVFHAVGF